MPARPAGPGPGPGRRRPGGARRKATSCGHTRPGCTHRRRPGHARVAGGVAAAAAAKKSASIRISTTAPYQLKARAQKRPMASHPSPASQPDQTRCAPADRPGASRAARHPRTPAATSPRAGARARAGHPPRPRGRQRGPGAAGAHKSACAADRPLAMQAGMPTPRYAAPATATPPRRASADSTPAVRSRWCTRYCGKASRSA